MAGHVQPHRAPAPVNALPAEILSQIFQYLAWMDSGGLRGQRWKRTKWLPAMLCCRKWRSIALETAGLWSTIVLDGKEPVDLYLKRSRMYPLEIIGSSLSPMDDRQYQRTLQLLTPAHIARFKILKVGTRRGMYALVPVGESVIAKLLSENAYAPQLEELCLEDSTTKFGLLNTFLSSQCPRLSNLALTDAFFPWGAHLSGMRSLRLTISADPPPLPYPYTFDEVFESLAAMPNLESLCMSHSLTGTVGDPHGFVKDHHPIRMPRLRSLTLGDNGAECWVLWALLVCDPYATVDVSCYQPSPIDIISMALSRHTRRPECPPYNSLDVDFALGDLTGENVLKVCLTGRGRPKIGLNIHVDDLDPIANPDIHVNTIDQATAHVLSSIPLENLTKLSLWAEHSPSDNLASLFTVATRITHLTLRGTDLTRALCSLFVPWDVLYGGGDLETNLPLPHLAEVEISFANLTHRVDLRTRLSKPIGEHLGLALTARKAAGHGVRRLNVEDECTLDRSWVRLWKEAVEEVEWDGDTGDEASGGWSGED